MPGTKLQIVSENTSNMSRDEQDAGKPFNAWAANRPKEKKSSLMKTIRNWVMSVAGVKTHEAEIKEVIGEIVDNAELEQLVLGPEAKNMLGNILSFFDLKVSDIMVPRVNIVSVDERASLDDIKATLRENEHTRMPVYRNNLDEVIGFLHTKDLIIYGGHDSDFKLKNFVREVLVVPPSMRVMDLLMKMRLSGVHIAIVVDEFGGTDGLVTLEDIFEEIVGEIQDEHDDFEETQLIRKLSETQFEADAHLEIENLEKFLGFGIDEDERNYDTLGGLIFHLLGKVPSNGDAVEYNHGIRFEIVDADSRRIKRVKIILNKEKAD